MKKLFLFLLRRYAKTESGRMEIQKELWYKVKDEYHEQTAFGNVYNMNIEVLMSNPFFERKVRLGEVEDLKMLKEGLSESFERFIRII